VTADPAAEENPAWSPAWTWLAFQSNRNGNPDIFTVKADCDPRVGETSDRCGLKQLTDSPADDLLPAWSPDGRSIAFVSTRDGNPEIYVMDKDGQNPRRLTFSPTGDWRPAWLPDSRHLLFTSDRGGNNDIYRIEVPPPGSAPLTSELGLTPVVTGPSDDRDPAVSAHDQLVFLSNREGLMRAYTLDLTWRGAEPHLLRDAKQTDGHPSWVDDASYAVLVAIERKGVSHIYRTCYSCEDEVLAPSSAFDGHPAWGPVWWLPDASASVEWLKGHQ
jgi:Tol biopolymer transport system component